jgi:hypothetical protein
MQQKLCLSVVVGLGLLGNLVSAEQDAAHSVPFAADVDRVAREEEKRVLKAMAKSINFKCQNMPLDEALSRVSEAIDCDVVVDLARLEDEGISPNLTVSLSIGEVTVWQTLHFLLEQYDLTWVANDGVLEVTTKNHADNVLVTRVYDVHKLCKSLEPLTREMFARQPRGKQNNRGGGMGGGGFFSIPATAIAVNLPGQMGGMGGPAGAPVQANQRMIVAPSVEAVLANMIMECTSLKWLVTDGDGGAVQLGQGCLIVSQSYQGQFEIAGMLQALEQLVDGKVQGKSIAARRAGYPLEEDAKIFETLARRTSLTIEAEPVQNVVRKIVSEAGLRLWFDETRISEEGIDLDEPIRLRGKMQRLPLAICLKKILEPFRLALVVEEGVVVVTTDSHAREMNSIRFYDISGISKIANEDPASGVVAVLSRSTHGRWQEFDGEGGAASLISSKHLAVLQTQQVHSEIALLIEDLTKDELQVPVEPTLELRVYTAPNVETARDLERVLPQLLQTIWSNRGSIRQTGESLFVTQPATVHDRLEEVLDKLEESYKRKHPNTKDPGEPEAQKDAEPKKE